LLSASSKDTPFPTSSLNALSSRPSIFVKIAITGTLISVSNGVNGQGNVGVHIPFPVPISNKLISAFVIALSLLVGKQYLSDECQMSCKRSPVSKPYQMACNLSFNCSLSARLLMKSLTVSSSLDAPDSNPRESWKTKP